MARARRDEPAPPPKPAAPCAECGAPAFALCHVCGVSLCADHGWTRLLISHCAKCAHKEGGTFYTHREIAAQRSGLPPPDPPAPRIDAAGWATLEAALAEKKKGDD